jgi:hypothetical protein
VPPTLLTLGKPDLRALEAARRIVDHARAQVAARGGAAQVNEKG